jgi:hypothetical protein
MRGTDAEEEGVVAVVRRQENTATYGRQKTDL